MKKEEEEKREEAKNKSELLKSRERIAKRLHNSLLNKGDTDHLIHGYRAIIEEGEEGTHNL